MKILNMKIIINIKDYKKENDIIDWDDWENI